MTRAAKIDLDLPKSDRGTFGDPRWAIRPFNSARQRAYEHESARFDND